MKRSYQSEVEDRFLQSLRRHLLGLRAKVESDFSQTSFERELAELERDPIYPKFGFDSPEYVLIRFMGRMSISIGRRLGEIYDKIPRFLAAARFELSQDQVAPKVNGLELDICLRFSELSVDDVKHIRGVISGIAPLARVISSVHTGLGIEIRYNFNPNDSARLRKDVSMVDHLKEQSLLPIYLIFSAISPREEAIARLKRAGWTFLIGDSAVGFAQALMGLDLAEILERPKIREEVRKDVAQIMKTMIDSYAFQKAIGGQVAVISSTRKL